MKKLNYLHLGKNLSALARVWSLFTRRKNFQPNSVEVMCEKHFDPELISSGKKRKDFWLKTGAVPTIYINKDNQRVIVSHKKA